jgi:caspase-like apoptosis-related cysteine protease
MSDVAENRNGNNGHKDDDEETQGNGEDVACEKEEDKHNGDNGVANNGDYHVFAARGHVPQDMVHTVGGDQPSIADLIHHHERRGSDVTSGMERGDSTDAKPANGSGGNRDEQDAWGFGRSSPHQNYARMPVEKDSEVYNMNHRRRGVAFVFNHMHFDPRLGLKERNGTAADRDNLRATLRSLDFEVRVFNDLTFKELDKVLEDCATKEDHSDADCVLVSVLSHGEMNILYGSDHGYKPERLWSYFTADKCPTLAGKPKLFFIQACQGDQLDAGVKLKRVTETDSNAMTYKIPNHADFLIAYSTIPGFYSWRNTSAGE